MNDYNENLEIIDVDEELVDELPDMFSDDVAEEAWEWALEPDSDDLPW